MTLEETRFYRQASNAQAANVVITPAPAAKHDIGMPDAPPAIESGVYLAGGAPVHTVREPVRLVVYGWYNVQPGTMTWTFPTAHAAIFAACAMRNATRWAIVKHDAPPDLEDARARGAILVEHSN